MAATRTGMTKSRISSYMRNVGKSFGYALGDSLKDMNPTVTAMFRSTAEQSKELYQSVKNFDAKSLGFQDSDLKGTISQGLKDLRNNALEDIRTGKWYNKDRMRSFENQMAEDMLGINFDDFGDFDDFNFDDTDLDEQASITEDATKATAKAMDAVGGKVSTAVSTAAIKSADYIVESGRANTKAIYSLNQAGFSQVNKGMAAINGNLQLLVNIAEPLTTHIQNSALFYTKTTEYQNKSLELLQQIVNNTAPKSSNAYGTSSNKRKTYGDYITADGVIDFKSLLTDGGKRLKDNAEMFTSMLGMIPGGEKGLIKMATASPLHFAMTTVISGLFNMKNKQGRSIKSAFEDFNKVLSNFSLGLLGRMKNARFGNNILSPYLRGIRDFLIPSDGKIQRKANSGNYEKGKVDWDGISRRALTDVIPKQLGQILSILERNFGPAGNYRVYDYSKGEFKDTRRIAAESKIEQRKIARGAGGDLFNDVRRSLKYSGMNTKDRRNYEKQLDSLLEYMMLTGNYNILSSGFDFGKAGMSGSMAADLQERIKAIGKTRGGQYKISALAGNVLSAGNKLDARNKNADNLENALVDKSIKSGKLLDSDEFGLNQSEYLRRILYNVSYIAKNLKNLVGVPGVGGYNKEGTQITWEDGDWITKSNNRAGKADTSSDKLPELSRSYDPKGSVEKTFGETPNGPSFSANEKEVLKKYGIDPANATDLDTLRSAIPDSEPLKDQILRNVTNYTGRQKVSSFASGIYNKFRNGKNGDKFKKFEESINASTDEVTAGLDRMAEGLNKFVYDKDFGLLSLMNTLSLGIATLIPKPIRDMAKAGWDKIKGSAFGQATGETLKSIGGSMLDWWSGNGSGLVNREYTRMQNGMYAGGNFWGNYERGSFSTQASPLLGYAGGRSKRNRSRRRRDSRRAQKAQSAEEAASEPPLEDDVEGESLLNKIAHTVSANLIDKISGVIGSGKEDPAKEKEKVQGTIKKLMEDAGLGKGAIGAGAVIGAGTSLLTGAFLGPIAGAAIGAAVGFASKSETAQKFLFGDFEDEIGPDGKPTGKKTDVRSGGLFSKELSNFMKDHGVSAAKGAGTGMLVGTFMGSPVLGAVLGATAGYIKSSETAKEAIFGNAETGKEGVIPLELQKTLKEKFPFFAGGIGAALLLAPGPLIPKLAIGATIGAVVGKDNGEGLKKWFFGEKGDDGKRKGGFLGYIQENLFNPILGTVEKGFNLITKFLSDRVGQLGRGLRSLGGKVKGLLETTETGKKIVGVGSAIGRGLGNIAKAPVWLAGAPFRLADAGLERMALRQGGKLTKDGKALTAAQRMELADKKRIFELRDSGSRAVDEYIASLGSEEELDEFIAAMEAEKQTKGAGQQTINKIIANSKNPYMKELLGKGLKYGDITHAIEQAQIDKSDMAARNQKLFDEETSVDNTVRFKIPSLLESISLATNTIVKLAFGQDLLDQNGDPSIASIQKRMKDKITSAARGAEEAANAIAEDEYENIGGESPEPNPNSFFNRMKNSFVNKFGLNLGGQSYQQYLYDKIRNDPANKAKRNINQAHAGFTDVSSTTDEERDDYEEMYEQMAGGFGDDESDFNDIYDQITGGGASGLNPNIDNTESDANASNSMRQAKKTKNTIIRGFSAIPALGVGLHKIFNSITDIGKGLFGKDEKKETLFDKIKNAIIGNDGLLGGLLGFFTGNTGIGGTVSKLLGKTGTFLSAAKAFLPGLIGSGLAIYGLKEAFDGKFDDLAHAIDKNYGGSDRQGDDLVDENGNKVTVTTDENGETHYQTSDGKEVDPENVQFANADENQTFSERLASMTARNALTGKKSLVGMVGKGVYRATLGKSKTFTTVAKAVTSAAAGDMAAMSILKSGIAGSLQKLPKMISKLPIFGPKLEPVATKIAEAIGKLCESTLKGGVKAAKFANVMKKIGVVVTVALFAVDFSTGYQEANTILGVEDTSTGEKVVAGLIKAIKNLIPIIDLIPTKTVADVLIDYVAPVFGIDVAELKERRSAAEDELDRINAEIESTGSWTDADGVKHEATDTFDNWTDYQKRGLGNYTWTEKAGNWFKNTFISNPGVKAGTYSGTTTGGGASGIITQFDPRYNRYHVGGKSFAANGCGPASAVMAMGGNLGDAVRVAQRYQTVGGTDAAYFGEMFNRNGMNAHFYTRGGGSSLIGDIASGKPTVLMGQDVFNTSKAYSPFGPNNHYVVANGFDRAGNLLISDPEQRGVRRYNPAILNNVKIGVSGGNSAYAAAMQSGNLNTSDTTSAPAAAANQGNTTGTAKSAMNYNSGPFVAPKETKQKNKDLGTEAARKEQRAISSSNAKAAASVLPMTPENCYNENLGVWSEVTAEEMNEWIARKNSSSPFNGRGEVFVQAGAESGLDPRYILAHAAIESGWGTSNIAKTKHNYFGIGAFDSNPSAAYSFGGSEDGLAYGIIEGAKWIARNYYNGKFKQVSVYKMRYNIVNGEPTHQYCTSDTWVQSIGQIMSTGPANTKLSLTDNPVNLGTHVSSSGNLHGGTHGTFGEDSETGGTTKKKPTIGGILSTITSAFAQGFGQLFNGGTVEEDETDPNASQENTQFQDLKSSAGVLGESGDGSGDMVNNFPYYNQTEVPWKSVKYGSGTISSSGCGPTSMAMVMRSYGSRTTPKDAAEYSLANGHRVEGQGTSWGFFQDIGGKAGLTVNQFSDSATARTMLDSKIPVIASMKAGDFTKGGHFMVLSGLNGNELLVNDPASRKRSAQIWDADHVFNQAKQYWAVSKDGVGSIGGFGGPIDVEPLTAAQDKEQLQADRFQMTAKAGSVKESAMGSGLLHYGLSKAGNYILRDNTRQYYSGGASGISRGGGSSIGGNLISTVKNTVANMSNAARKTTRDTAELPTNVSAIKSNTDSMAADIHTVAEYIRTIQKGNNVPKDTTVPNNQYKIPDDVTQNLMDLTSSITTV